MSHSLENLKVLDLSMNLPGPYMTWLMASLGAEVVKVENPDGGDSLRRLGKAKSDRQTSPYFEAVNRNKKSITLNLKHPEAKTLFFKLLDIYDVVVEGFRPGTMERLGLGFESTSTVQPRLIHLALSSYGQHGPNRLRAGYDLNCLSLAGIMSMTGTRDGRLAIPGIQIADVGGGSLIALVALLAAVIQREKTGKGQFIDASIFHGTLSLATMMFGAVEAGAEKCQPGSMMLNGGAACYGVYETSDGRHMSLAAVEPKFWKNFCSAIGKTDLEESQYGGTQTIEELRRVFAERTQAEWMQLLEQQDTACEPVLTLDEVANLELVRARDMITRDPQGRRQLRSPLRVGDRPPVEDLPAPSLGEHIQEVLGSIGLSSTDVEALARTGVI
jgi:crotonobetainyl-CoA:carnitine CoA-transferase CaiB-like acyl-CoA transferase